MASPESDNYKADKYSAVDGMDLNDCLNMFTEELADQPVEVRLATYFGSIKTERAQIFIMQQLLRESNIEGWQTLIRYNPELVKKAYGALVMHK